MAWWAWTIIGVYGAGFLFTLWLNMAQGPITLGLSFVRALTWPIWWASMFLGFSWLEGETYGPD